MEDGGWRVEGGGWGGVGRKNGRQILGESTGLGLGLAVGEVQCKRWGGEGISAGSRAGRV